MKGYTTRLASFRALLKKDSPKISEDNVYAYWACYVKDLRSRRMERLRKKEIEQRANNGSKGYNGKQNYKLDDTPGSITEAQYSKIIELSEEGKCNLAVLDNLGQLSKQAASDIISAATNGG